MTDYAAEVVRLLPGMHACERKRKQQPGEAADSERMEDFTRLVAAT
eukprot:CAMPEP_0206600684 /NCGR_PEP_ID=MMETSP0325_2-20121206/46000_1 /ASSEMBLY_ACC=CAM_ASM_000347 /TAXON_ID=2866 /ORGANISM="Crypthecodinium cohnii, Strain Seligo" /LENGTH=45 /DNA_ID= /DNA_START= /DNA_END= /DNA_ORIENTATION=